MSPVVAVRRLVPLQLSLGSLVLSASDKLQFSEIDRSTFLSQALERVVWLLSQLRSRLSFFTLFFLLRRYERGREARNPLRGEYTRITRALFAKRLVIERSLSRVRVYTENFCEITYPERRSQASIRASRRLCARAGSVPCFCI